MYHETFLKLYRKVLPTDVEWCINISKIEIKILMANPTIHDGPALRRLPLADYNQRNELINFTYIFTHTVLYESY